MTKRLPPCPYCYTPVDFLAPMFRCIGRPAPGRSACTKDVDPRRVEVLDDSTPLLPAFRPVVAPRGRIYELECSSCLGVSSMRLCANCHSPLPSGFTDDSPLFGMVGVRGSGKTVMLTVLARELTTSVGRRFDAAIDAVGTSELLTRLDTFRKNLEGDGTGTLPQKTETFTRKETVPAVFEWRMDKRGRFARGQAATIFSFYDTSGEDLATLDVARQQHYLGATDGLILLLDPFGLPANRDKAVARGVDPDLLKDMPIDVLSAVTGMLRDAERVKPGKKIKRPLAVVLSKIDAFFDEVGPDDPVRRTPKTEPVFDEVESADLHLHVESLVHSWGGDAVLRHLRQNYGSYRFFVASALGAQPEYSTGRVSNQGLRPHRVAEPLLWLMAQRSFLPKGR